MSSAVTHLLGRLSLLSGNWQLPFLNQLKGENDRRKYFTINLHERMLPTLAGVEPVTSWSPVGRRIQMSHPGRPFNSYPIAPDQEKLSRYFFFLFLHENVCCRHSSEVLLMTIPNMYSMYLWRNKKNINPLYTDTCYNNKIRYDDDLTVMKPKR